MVDSDNQGEVRACKMIIRLEAIKHFQAFE